MEQMPRRLERGRDQIVSGVCSGLAEHFDIDPLWVRLAFVVLSFAYGTGFLVYIALWILMPAPGGRGIQTAGDLGATVRGMGGDLRRAGEGVWTAFSGDPGAPPGPAPDPAAGSGGGSEGPGSAAPGGPGGPGQGPLWGGYSGYPPGQRGRRRGVTGGVILILAGIWFLLDNLGLLGWWQWNLTWPLILIVIGLALLVQRLR